MHKRSMSELAQSATSKHLPQVRFSKKTLRVSLLVLLALSFAGMTSPLRAQQQSSAPQQSAPPQEQQVGRPRDNQGIGHQLVHETREAAGEEKDETEEFKRSPAVIFMARVTGLSLPNAYLFCVVLNFVVIAALILWAARKYLPAILNARTAAIQKAMQEAQKASEEARRRLAEIESRLMKLDVEIGMMRDAAEKEAAAEEARIEATAQEDARKLVESAQQEIASAAKTARRELTAYAAELAVGLAQKQIHVDASTDQALVRHFTGELGSENSARPGKDGR